tara:strand:+ start:284 stop:514 length:231 start_codon:yes stop_codon:yes gene_type:complete
MKGQLREVNRGHVQSEVIKHAKSIIEEGGKCPSTAELVAWAVKTYKVKGEPYDLVQKFGKDLKCSRTVQRYHKVLN